MCPVRSVTYLSARSEGLRETARALFIRRWSVPDRRIVYAYDMYVDDAGSRERDIAGLLDCLGKSLGPSTAKA